MDTRQARCSASVQGAATTCSRDLHLLLSREAHSAAAPADLAGSCAVSHSTDAAILQLARAHHTGRIDVGVIVQQVAVVSLIVLLEQVQARQSTDHAVAQLVQQVLLQQGLCPLRYLRAALACTAHVFRVSAVGHETAWLEFVS